ncbi:MAG: type II secretion system F family protein [Gemmatimonas sp.]
MLQFFTLLVVFVATTGLLYGSYVFFNRRTLAASDAVVERLREMEQAVVASQSILLDDTVSDLPVLDRLLAPQKWTATLAGRLHRAGSKMSPGSFVLRTALAAGIGFIIGALLQPGLLLALASAAIGAAVCFAWLSSRESSRAQTFQEQLPDALDMLVSAMKAGYSLQAGMKFVGDEMTAPLGPEFMRFYEEQRLGVEVRTALLAMQHRVNDLDFRMFVIAVLIQRESGGNLSEVLGRISSLMRERAALKGEVASLTAESKMSGRILSVLPVLVFLVITLMSPDFTKPMTSSVVGPWILAGAVVSVVLGYFVMMRIADIEL